MRKNQSIEEDKFRHKICYNIVIDVCFKEQKRKMKE